MTTRAQVLDQALALGHRCGWEKLSLDAVARALDVPLGTLYEHFPQKDDIVEAWFDRADRALLDQVPNPVWSSFSPRDRVEQVLLCWLDALAPHRKLTGQMLLYKFEPGHIHLQAAGVLRVSRTVQWFREAAELKATHLKRISQELALTSIYLATFSYWLRDSSTRQRKTRRFLKRQLDHSERIGLWQ
ncbi:TetR/AcrR family transcriptional regulator [Marinimicrobium alkaliphilum]|uniref:TetR/AcrR family transcriptional regulator n=1 Tax=Marinimicrobium alkaliphilum TaxID=2202654 RepID=UPI000DB9708B|nr:TetR/AcrR family transcriptional regulator [Marinimicrobium alkaliphilum]